MTEVAEIKIALADIAPEIWRRVVVPASITLAGLHTVIQAAMGWEDSHLHMFMLDGQRYGRPEEGDRESGSDLRDAADQRLGDLIMAGDRFLYVYDFGDDWRHEITVAAIRALEPDEAVPAVLAGARACPPDDSGGPHGYPEMLQALRDPDHQDHAHHRDWIGSFDGEAFDLGLANKRLRAHVSPSGSGH